MRVVLFLFDGEFVEIKDVSLGCIRKRKTVQDINMIKSQGFGLSWGMSLRRGYSSFSSLKG